MTDPSPNDDSKTASAIAAATTQICIATMVLLGTFMIMCWIVLSGRFVAAHSFSRSLNLLLVISIPLLTNIAAAQRLRRMPVLSAILLVLTCVGCGWHLFLFGIFTFETLSRGILFLHGLAAIFVLLTLLVHFATAALFIPIAMIAERRLGADLFFTHLRQDIRTSRPRTVASLYGGTAILLCLIAAWCSARFLRPELTVSFTEPYDISALSSDSAILAVGCSQADHRIDESGSKFTLLETNTLQPVAPAISLPQCLRKLEYVSPEFGFLAILMQDAFRGVPGQKSTVEPRLIQISVDGSIRNFDCLLPEKIFLLSISPNHEIAAIGSLDDTTHEAQLLFVSLVDGKEISSFQLSDSPFFEVQFTTDSSHALLVTMPSQSSSTERCSLIGIKDESIEQVLELNRWTKSNNSSTPDTTSQVHEFSHDTGCVQIWFADAHWHYRFSPKRIRSTYGGERCAGDRIATARWNKGAHDSAMLDGSHDSTEVVFHQGQPPHLLSRRVVSNGPGSDFEITADGSRIFLMQGGRISVYRFPEW
ncbi:MAG: hypothetical protein JNM43_13880 [Planctomycetaceae bacterium]|nr:hypothetical protein [Planctomycetaceae bacterium]